MIDRSIYKVPVTVYSPDGQTTEATVEPRPAEKLVKYFPAEALALYTTLDPIVRETFTDDVRWALWTSLVLSVVFCWVILDRLWKVKPVLQKVISCVTLVVYVATLGGPFGLDEWFRPGYAAIAAVVLTALLVFLPAPINPDDHGRINSKTLPVDQVPQVRSTAPRPLTRKETEAPTGPVELPVLDAPFASAAAAIEDPVANTESPEPVDATASGDAGAEKAQPAGGSAAPEG